MSFSQRFINQIILFSLVLLPVLTVEAQVTITGSVVDDDGTALPTVNVLLLEPSDSTMIKGAVTDNEGIYRLQNVDSGSYLLSISMVGFRKQFVPEFNANQGIIELEPVRLSESIEQLDEVAVTARRPLFEQKIDRLVVNVQSSITSAGSSILEVLEKSPGIQVNRQSGGITMSGKSGVRVMINDKVVRLPLDAVVQMLDGMNAANVEQIELISSPPARYEAEGDAGIINIKMSEHTDLGYTGTVGGNLGYNWAETLGGNVNFSRRGRKLAFFVNYSVNHDRRKEAQTNERYSQRESFLEKMSTDIRKHPVVNIQNARLGLEYNLSRKTTVGVLMTGYRRMWNTRDLSDNISRLGPDSTLTTEMDTREINHWRNSLVNVNMDHDFREGQNLSVDLDYLFYIQENPSEYQIDFVEGNHSLMGAEGMNVKKDTPIHFWVGRIDYRDRLSPDFTFETGIKGTLSRFFNDVHVSEHINENWVTNPRYSNDADLSEQIGAIYLSGKWNPADDLQINGGLRYEYTDSYLSTPDQQGLVDRNYSHLFPTLFFQKKLSAESSLGVSYSRRITRPTFNDMAPFVYFLSPNTSLSGNPALKPSVTDGIKLDYQPNPWLISLQYSYAKDAIGPFQSKIDPETNEQTYSAENLDFLRTYGLTTSFPVEFTSWWEIQTNLSGQYQIYKTAHLEEDLSRNVAAFTLNVTNSIDLSAEMALEVSGYYQSKSLWGHVEFRPQGSVNVGIQKRIAGGQGVLRLATTDILRTDNWQAYTELPNIDTNEEPLTCCGKNNTIFPKCTGGRI